MSDYNEYVITEKAGRIVANRVNTGVGTKLWMTVEEAAASVEAGMLVLVEAEEAAEDEAGANGDGGGSSAAPERDLSKMNKASLLQQAQEAGVEIGEDATKADIIAAISAKRDAEKKAAENA
jgi:hypothetical protein